MFFDVLDAILLVAESFCWIFATKFANNSDGCFGNMPRELNLLNTTQNNVVDLHGITGCEGWPENYRTFCFVKFNYSEKATKFCEISTLLLTVCTVVKS